MVSLVDVEDDVLITSGHLLYASMRQLQLYTCDFGMGHKNQRGCVPKVLKGIAMNVSYVFQDHFYLIDKVRKIRPSFRYLHQFWATKHSIEQDSLSSKCPYAHCEAFA